MNFSPSLKRFARRVRFLRAWVGLGVGLSIGAVLATLWSVLDWMNLFYTEWSYLGWLVGVCGALGLLIGASRPISSKSLTDSIDRRADLKNRLSTATERSTEHGSFDDALREDAGGRLEGLQPSNLYPIKLNRWHGGALVFSLLAACLFMLGNTPLLMGKEAKANRAKMQDQAAAIERVVKPLEDEAKKGETNAEEKKLAKDLRKLSQDLHKARIDPEEAMRRQNELSKQAEKLTENRDQQVQQNMQTAQSMLQKMQAEQAKKDEQNKMDGQKLDSTPMQTTPEEDKKALDDLKNELNSMKLQMKDPNLTDQQKQDIQKQLSQMQNAEKEASDLQNQIDELNRQLASKGLTAQQKADLMKKLAALQKKLSQQLQMTKEMQAAMDKMMKDPMMKEIMDLAAKAQIELSKDPGGDEKQQELTKAEMDALQKEAEEMAKKLLSDDKFMKEYLQAIIDALKSGKIKLCNHACMNPFKLPLQLPIPGAPSKDLYFANTGFINKGAGEKSRGKTFTTSVTGQSRDVPGQNAYIEMRGPTGQGLRSSIPYEKVLPSYKRKADEAMNRQEIPPEHQKRVKKYFESLGQ
jgi:hypothetical protein